MIQITEQEAIISAQEIEYSYPDGTKALNKVTLYIPKGAKVAILGANGAGKSTLFLHFNGILQPKAGKVYFCGQPIQYNHKFLGELRRNVGIVFQDPDNQLFSASVYQDISFGPLNLKLSKEEVRQRVEEAMEITSTTELKNKPTHLLSTGEKKRVSIAGVLAMDPSVIILDEPTASLDPHLVNEMLELFEKLHKAGKTLILSTHDMDLAYRWADYCYILNRGKVVEHGLPEKVFMNTRILEENNLQKPWVLQVFEKMTENGLIDHTPRLPRTSEELFRQMKKAGRS